MKRLTMTSCEHQDMLCLSHVGSKHQFSVFGYLIKASLKFLRRTASHLSILSIPPAYSSHGVFCHSYTQFTYTGRLNFFPCNTLSRSQPSSTPGVLQEHSLGIVDPEEIRIEHRLHQPCYPGYLIHITFGEISVEPIRNVQCPVKSQSEEVMRRYRFGLACSL